MSAGDRLTRGGARRLGGREALLALALALPLGAGCAGSPAAGGTTSAEASHAPRELLLQCEPGGASGVSEESAGAPTPTSMSDDPMSRAEGAPPPTPAPTRGAAAPRPADASLADTASGERESLPGLYAAQEAGLGALACALDASDCGGAASLVEQICRLATRVCGLDASDPHCDEARARCAHARARVSASCGGDERPR